MQEKDANHLGRSVLAGQAELLSLEAEDEQQPGPSSRNAQPVTRRSKQQKRPLEDEDFDMDVDEPQPGPSSGLSRHLTRMTIQKKKSREGNDSESEEDDEPSGKGEPEQLARQKNVERVWHNDKPKIFGMAVPELDEQPMKQLPEDCKSPYEFLKLFLSDQFVEKVVEYSKSYAVRRGREDLLSKLSSDNLWLSFGVMYMTGYISPSYRRMYWEEREDTRNPMVRKAISRQTFEDIIHHTHFTDKVKTFLYNFLNNLYINFEKNCKTFFKFSS